MLNIAFPRVRMSMKVAGLTWRRILPRVRARKEGLGGEITALFIQMRGSRAMPSRA